MNVLVVSAHPAPESLCRTLQESVVNVLNQAGHTLRHHDLYLEQFDPVFTSFERLNHTGPAEVKLQQFPELRPYVENLQWCEALVLVYPTWWSGQPAILKGWFDRILMSGVAWVLPEGVARISPALTNVRKLVVVTTHGSSKLVNAIEGEGGKRTAFRSVRLMFHPRARSTWLAFYGVDHSSENARTRFIRRVERKIVRALG